MIAKILATVSISYTMLACASEPIDATHDQMELTSPTDPTVPTLPDWMVGTWSCNSHYNTIDVWHTSHGPSTYTVARLPNGHMRGQYHEERTTGRDDFSDEWSIAQDNDGTFLLDYSLSAEDGTVAEATGTIVTGSDGIPFVQPNIGTVHMPDGTKLGWEPNGFAFQGPLFGTPPGLNLAWGFDVQISEIGPGFEEYFAMNCTQK